MGDYVIKVTVLITIHSPTVPRTVTEVCWHCPLSGCKQHRHGCPHYRRIKLTHRNSRHSPRWPGLRQNAALYHLISSTDMGAYLQKLTVLMTVLATHQQWPGLWRNPVWCCPLPGCKQYRCSCRCHWESGCVMLNRSLLTACWFHHPLCAIRSWKYISVLMY